MQEVSAAINRTNKIMPARETKFDIMASVFSLLRESQSCLSNISFSSLFISFQVAYP
jgi:hypothetical protein